MDTLEGINTADIAFVRCNSNSRTSSVSPAALLDKLRRKEPRAIVLYTNLDNQRCDIKGIEERDYSNYYTFSDYTTVMNFIPWLAQPETRQVTGSISLLDTASEVPLPKPTQSSTTGQTPAVAMSILYAVSGVITILFIAIITTGAWRAHTNPERYGPRMSVGGQPRRSRAKGLAKAMLETIPIVKFGDPVVAKNEDSDVEMQAPSKEVRTSSVDKTPEQTRNEIQSHTTPVHIPEASREASDEGATKGQPQPRAQGSNVGCSICTEDFKKGEDVRVLPCNHQYHPACIDPWLLNLSSTCPLW